MLKFLILAVLISGVINNKKDLVNFQRFVMLCISLLALWGIDQHLRGNVRLEGLGGQSFGDSNGVAAVAALFFPIALNNFLTNKKKQEKFIWLLSTVTITGLIVFSQSRGGFLGMLAAVVYLIFRARQRKKLVVLCCLAVLITTPFLGKHYKHRLMSINVESEERDYSAASRLVYVAGRSFNVCGPPGFSVLG